MAVSVRRLAQLEKKLSGLTKAEVQELTPEVLRTLLAIQAIAKGRVRVRTGRLRNSIDYEMDAEPTMVRGRAGTNVEYAPFEEFGTAPHVIRAKDGGVLAFKGNARQSIKTRKIRKDTVFATEVHHPGTRANPFMFPAFEQVRPDHLRRVAAAMDRAHRRVAGGAR